jgi:nucleotide-binding universal stress UspA family protein
VHPIARILVPTDFSGPSREAIEVATELARKLDASLTLMHAWQVTISAAAEGGMDYAVHDISQEVEVAARDQLRDELAKLRTEVPAADSELRSGNACEEILDTARRRQADLIVMGTHGRTGFKRALLGSIAEKIVRLSPIPVLTVGRPKRRSGESPLEAEAS